MVSFLFCLSGNRLWKEGWKEQVCGALNVPSSRIWVLHVWNQLYQIFKSFGVHREKQGFKKKSLFVSADLCMGRKVRFHSKSSPSSAFGILQAYFSYHLFFILEFVNIWGKILSRCCQLQYNYKRSERHFDVLAMSKAFFSTERKRTTVGSGGPWLYFKI